MGKSKEKKEKQANESKISTTEKMCGKKKDEKKADVTEKIYGSEKFDVEDKIKKML